MRTVNLCLVAACAVAVVGMVPACSGRSRGSQTTERWNDANSPFVFSANYERRFSRLPQSAFLPETPWSDTYWPSSEGGIAARWTTYSNGFDYAYLSPNEVLTRSFSTRDLSPAEKYDVFMRRYDFPTVKAERQRVSPNNEGWEGLCHGWSPASLDFHEPSPVTLRNADGVEVQFGSSDVKALLTYSLGVLWSGDARFIGQRCNQNLGENPGDGSRPECKDVNAGSFHLALANQLGVLKEGFVADVTRDLQVWNQPVHGFTSRVIREQGASPGAAPGTVKEIVMETEMTYGVETSPSWEKSQASSSRTYTYRVELNQAGEIIGGEWEDDNRPDFLWVKPRPTFTGYYKGIETVYNASVGNVQPTPRPTPNPTPVPTVTPRPTPNPTPVPTVRPGNLVCPYGELQTTARGGHFCATADEAIGPFNETLIEKCSAAGGGRACHSSSWNLQFYIRLRGDGVCPAGASVDAESGFCEEGRFAIGPFSQAVINACQAAGGGAGCEELRWDRQYMHDIVRGMRN